MSTKPKSSTPVMLRRGEIARRLGVSPRTLSFWVMRGDFPPPDVRVGMRSIRWKESTLNDWIEAGGAEGMRNRRR
jgi:predicted DNA-binding transcriptional regulator AlpA